MYHECGVVTSGVPSDGAWPAAGMPWYGDRLDLMSGVAWTNWFVRVLRTGRIVRRARSNEFGRGTQSLRSCGADSPFQRGRRNGGEGSFARK